MHNASRPLGIHGLFFEEVEIKMKSNVRAKLYYLPYPELRSLLGVSAYRG